MGRRGATDQGRAKGRRPSLGTALGVVAVLIAMGGVAYASIPAPGGVIRACYVDATGALSVIDSQVRACPTGSTLLTWSQTGPAGQDGATGPTGATGPAGPQGPKGGFTSIRRVKFAGSSNNHPKKTVTVNCASDEVATGGGHQLVGSIAKRVTTRSFPVHGSPPTGWQVKAIDTSGPFSNNWYVIAWAVCAKL